MSTLQRAIEIVRPGQKAREVAKQYDNANMQGVVGVYSLAIDQEMQLREHSAFHWD
ncbi:MAG: hypothetical protein HYU36_09945 [Planctomycetes bacterium]|nr:hypothetical protein [Planctomycetota bacterium]